MGVVKWIPAFKVKDGNNSLEEFTKLSKAIYEGLTTEPPKKCFLEQLPFKLEDSVKSYIKHKEYDNVDKLAEIIKSVRFY